MNDDRGAASSVPEEFPFLFGNWVIRKYTIVNTRKILGNIRFVQVRI